MSSAGDRATYASYKSHGRSTVSVRLGLCLHE